MRVNAKSTIEGNPEVIPQSKWLDVVLELFKQTGPDDRDDQSKIVVIKGHWSRAHRGT